jgi:Protein of unknown function (DUF1552)
MTFIAKRAIPRRTVLRGMGASLALPFLDAMVPAFAAQRTTLPGPVRRLGVVYVPNGMAMQQWTPLTAGEGIESKAFTFSPTLRALEPFRDQLVVIGGLSVAKNAGDTVHARASTRFLTGVPPREDIAAAAGSGIQAGISMDQVAARALAAHTQLASLELALDANDFAGSCDGGYSCAYTSTISWRGPTTPLPMEYNPRVVFERLFGDGGTTDPAARQARLKKDRNILDSVSEGILRLEQGLGASDRSKFQEYLEAVRDAERRIQTAEQQSQRELPLIDQPAGIPATYEEHAKLMFDLQVLAYQCDLTRVITFMMARELSGRAYPQIGVSEAHHSISHHSNDPGKLKSYAAINAHHVSLLAYYAGKLKATADGDGSLLDHMILLFGCGMSDGNGHTPRNLPIVVLGGATRGGRYLNYPGEPSVANLHLTLLDKLGAPTESLGDSSGRLDLLA